MYSQSEIKKQILAGRRPEFFFNFREDRIAEFRNFYLLFESSLKYTINARFLKKTKCVLFRANKENTLPNDNCLQVCFDRQLEIFHINEFHGSMMMNAADEIWDIIIQNYHL